ncbi:site-specific tyrosine recombinase/integron integrase [Haloarcula salina]|uniref:Tyrosine-type recombinase/integrase n=1 Tax=Haloarcula salina TaxID=1429914 RepID=A0AA41FZ26_9EURY|nr:site-specific tyrosine recombinase/integron integrase [Haloarcula salina]MBV0901412.1 tyrosine-type recombinase/integrase [Haloarcula salina]
MGAEPNASKIYDNKHDEVTYFLTRKEATGRSTRTLNSYSRILREFFHDQFPDLSPDEVEIRHVEDYLMALTDRGVSQNSKKKYLEVLSSFYGYTMKRPQFEGITSNPAAVVMEEIPRIRPDRPDCATWENACKLINAIPDPRDKTVAIILAKTGARLLEVLSIEEDDVDLEKGFIRLRERKGGKQTVVPIDDETIYAIKRYQFVNVDSDSPYLFTSNRGGRLSKERIRREVKEAADRAGVAPKEERRFEKKFTPHTFRTVFTTLMRKQGMKPYILKYIRGDAKTETMDIYTRVDRDEAKEEYLNCIKEIGL